MEEPEFTVTAHDYWKNTFRSVEAAYCFLATYEETDNEVIGETLAALRKFISLGPEWEDVKGYSTQPKNTPPFQKKKNYYAPVSINYDLDSNWRQLDNNTIEVDLGEGRGKALAVSVTKAEQLDEMIAEIRKTNKMAVDCEFLGTKNKLPELKLLQIGVSKEKGYAIQVDIIGQDIVSEKLKPLFEDDNLMSIGWSFRPDALAIESYIKDVNMAAVLDLQAKLKSEAIETMNLSAAMAKYCGEWVGQAEFQKAKQYGHQFPFNGPDCIWLKNPLPPRALVYAVFDVLSVFALEESTVGYPNQNNHFWPFTITSTSSQKSLEKFHRQRAMGINSASGNQDLVAIVKSDNRQGKQKMQTITTTTVTNDGYDDEDIRYKKDLQAALELSIKEHHSPSKGESSKKADRVIAEEEVEYTDIADELKSNPYNRRFSTRLNQEEQQEQVSSEPEIIENAWGMEVLEDQPFIGGKFQFDTNNQETISVPKTQQEQISSPPTFKEEQRQFSRSPRSNGDHALSSGHHQDKRLYLPRSSQSYASAQSIDYSYGNKKNGRGSPAVANKQWNIENIEPANKSRWGDQTSSLESDGWGNKSPNAQPERDNNRTSSYSSIHATPVRNSNQTSPAGTSKWITNAKQWSKSNASSVHTWGSSNNNSGRNNANTSSPRTSDKLAKPQHIQRQTTPQSTITPQQSQRQQQPVPPTQSPLKPDKHKFSNVFRNRVTMGNQGGAFTWAEAKGDEMSPASWSSFASTTVNDWHNGKDTELNAITNSVVVNNQSTPSTPREVVAFNTTVQSSYVQGGTVGDRNNGKMHTNEDNWSRQEIRPDVMQMAMNQIPVRKEFAGPRIMNPDDEMSEDDDEDNTDTETDIPMLKANFTSVVKSAPQGQGQKAEVEAMETFVDAKFLYDQKGHEELFILRLTKKEHLNMIVIPPIGTNFTVTICYHFVNRKQDIELKALQLYLSTGESYTVVIEQAILLKDWEQIKMTKFGDLLTDPTITRICWCPGYIEKEMLAKIGFPIGRCVDLSMRANHGRSDQDAFSFVGAINHYLNDWPDKDQFTESKKDYEAFNAKKFSSTCWDRETLPHSVLVYSAFQGLASHALYMKTTEVIDAPDEIFTYESTA